MLTKFSRYIRSSAERPGFWMVLACMIWLWIFRDYFTGRCTLFSDAISYCDHARYYVEGLKKGVFPLWDYFWNHGSPNDFFLRRIGAYNPIYIWLLILDVFGIAYHAAYLLTMAAYFFLGAVGFYYLAKVVYKDDRVAFSAFALLLFSAVGTRIFDSYMCLVIVPTIWFIYFAYSFLTDSRRRYLAGLCLSFMIAMNTYIPLFFVTIILVVGLFWVAFFPKEALLGGRRIFEFVRRNFLFSLGMIAVVAVSLIPPLLFFLQTASGGLVMPERHGASGVNHVLGVDTKLLSWGIMEDLYFTSYYMDFRRFMLALVYVPFLGVALWVLGVFCRINRKVFLYFAVGIFFLLLGTPLALPLHQFLYDHVFYFKYIRNLHFFLWFILLPLSIFVAAEFLSQILQMSVQKTKARWVAASAIVSVHVAFIVWMMIRGDGALMYFVAVVTSLVLGLGYIFRPGILKGWVLWLAILIVIVPQAAQVFNYAIHNMPQTKAYEYDALNSKLDYVTQERPNRNVTAKRCDSLYYSTAEFYDLCDGVSSYSFSSALTHKLVAYGRMEPFDGSQGSYARLDAALSNNENVAFVTGLKQPVVLSSGSVPERFKEGSSALSVVSFQPNRLKLKTDFKEDRFLVYNDNFAPGWRVLVDGKQAALYKANAAFKGVKVPAGRRLVEFRYEVPFWYAFNWLLLIVFNVFFYGIMRVMFKARNAEIVSKNE